MNLNHHDLPPHKPRRLPARRRLLGDAEPYTMEPSKTNSFDKDIAFDFNIANHLLKLAENAYQEFNPEPRNKNLDRMIREGSVTEAESLPRYSRADYRLDDTFNYNVIENMGSEGFGATEQGKMYYSKSDNIISISYRGTDFNRGFSTMRNPMKKYPGVFYARPDMLLADIINDLDIRQTQFEELLLHEGFLNFYLKTQEQVFKFIETYADADTLFYTTGHSYGGIPSVILGYMIKDPITLLPPSKLTNTYIDFSWYHTGTTLFLDGGNKNEALETYDKFLYWWRNREQGIRIIDDLEEANNLYNTEIGMTGYVKLFAFIVNTHRIGSKIWDKFKGIRNPWSKGDGFFATIGLTTVKDVYNFVELNKHSLETYDVLLSKHRYTHDLFGINVRSEKQMLQDMDAIKDKEHNFYSKTKQEFNDKPIFTQTDNEHLKFVPHFHKDTGITMQPIPANLQQAILGFVVLSDEQYNSPNTIKGVCVY